MLHRLLEYEQCGEATINAFEIASECHKGQKIIGTKTDFIIHPFSVAYMVASMGHDEEVVVAALLHDTVEKGCHTRESLIKLGVSRIAANAVMALTVEKEPPHNPRDKNYSEKAHKQWTKKFYKKTRSNIVSRAIRPFDQQDRYIRSGGETRFLKRKEELWPQMPTPEKVAKFIARKRLLYKLMNINKAVKI